MSLLMKRNLSMDWAEVFNIVQIRNYLAPIAAVYAPGVLIDYFSDEIFVSRMNNIPQEDLDLYTEEFRALIYAMNLYTMDNMKIKLSKIGDQISSKELHSRFDKEMIKVKKDWSSLPEAEKYFRLQKSERNYKGDLSKLSKEEKYTILFNSTVVHDTFIFGDWEEGIPWAFDVDMIPIGFRYTGEWGVHLKSSRTSTVQFWVGHGCLKKIADKLVPTILTYNQYMDTDKKSIDVKTVVSNISPALEMIEVV